MKKTTSCESFSLRYKLNTNLDTFLIVISDTTCKFLPAVIQVGWFTAVNAHLPVSQGDPLEKMRFCEISPQNSC